MIVFDQEIFLEIITEVISDVVFSFLHVKVNEIRPTENQGE